MSSTKDKKMPSCEGCRQQSCLEAGKPCEKIEHWLRWHKIKGREWIRPEVSKEMRKDGKGRCREVPFSAIKWDVDQDFAHDR